MSRLLSATVLALTPGLALAQSQLDRLEQVTETSSEAIFELMIAEMAGEGVDAEALRAVIPDMTWDDDMRAAGSCMLDAYVAEVGTEGLDTMLDNMETLFADLDGMSMDEISAQTNDILPEGLTDERSMAITQECGMIDLQMQRMSESGFMDAMMQAAMN